MTYFRSLHSHLQVLSKEDLKGTYIEHGFKRAFMSLFGQDDDTFTSTMFLNVDQLQKQLDKDEFQEDKSVAERTRHQRQYDRRVNKRQMQTQENADDTNIRPIYDEELMAKVQLTAECNIFATGQQHIEQPEIINEGRVDPEQCQVKSPMLDSSFDNKTTEFSS
ncbi:hypothetical protein Tco_1285375 [Tanacetum coccineum]